MNNSFLKKLVFDWHNARKNAALVKSLFQSENAFRFKATGNLAPASDVFLHCYLAIDSGKLKCLLITNKNDTQQQHNQQGGLTVVTTTAKLITSVLPIVTDSDTIDEKEAKARVERWTQNRNAFIDRQAATASGMQLAFVIPTRALTLGDEYTAFFALQTDPDTQQDQAALILTDNKARVVGGPKEAGFFNTINPVPPFGKKAELELKNFFLRKLVLEQPVVV